MSKFFRSPHLLRLRLVDKLSDETLVVVNIFNELGISLIKAIVKVADHCGFFQQSDFRHFLRIGA